MEKTQSRLFIVSIVVLSLVAAAILLSPAVEEQLAPEPRIAWVAIEPAGAGVAEVGWAKLDAGAPFTLHAVLEARDRDDRPVYYTTAPALRIMGERIDAERLRVWDRRLAKVRWFTVEGRRPYVQLDAETGIAAFELQEFLRSDWPVTWSIPGQIDPAHDDHLEQSSPLGERTFGTQRYHVRIELYRDDTSLVPERVIRSWGIADLKENVGRFPTAQLSLPAPLGPASEVFGLSLLDPPPGAGQALLRQIDELASHDLAFSRLSVLRDQIRATGRRIAELEWGSLDLRADVRWGEGAGPGDLLRAGDRLVVLYEDRGIAGIVDDQDLCFDYVQGAEVRALGEVFAGSGDNVVELARLGS